VLLAAGDGGWKGSGRSIPAFDLHAGLGACSHLLERWGGHRAAAGLSLADEQLEAFIAAFGAYADERLEDRDLESVTVVDAIVAPRELTLDLAGELARLAPFGLGNPGVTLLLAGCEIAEPSAVGEGRHLRFRVRDPERGRDAGSAIAFGMGAQLDRLRRVGAYDVAFRLQENRWNGTVAPQLVVRRVFDSNERYHDLRRRFAAEFPERSEWSDDARLVFAELGLDADSPSWRSLLESSTFRALLEGRDEEVMPRAA
jgi:single-stranded-DNA-specific exonuclease